MKKLLKKLALLPLFCGLVLTSGCSDNNSETGEKLPSRISFGDEVFTFSYDSQNRITRIGLVLGESAFITEIIYNTNGSVAKFVGENETTINVSFSGDTVTIEGQSQFTINSRGQMVRFWGIYDFYTMNELDFTYDASGNLTQMLVTSFDGEQRRNAIEYSPTTRAVFRNTTTPEWFLQLMLINHMPAGFKHGFMPVRVVSTSDSFQGVTTITYTVENGWVQTVTENTRTWHFEYVNAR